ncbi:MAG TPA: hypothetical protein VI258_00340 [Rhodanobacteraceae bacterium]
MWKIARTAAAITGVLVVSATGVQAQLPIGIAIAPPPQPRVVPVPPAPGPDVVWIDGYWYPVGREYRWHDGYWTRPPYEGARWFVPRYDGERFYAGFWYGERGLVQHDHRWDRERDRDSHHDRRNAAVGRERSREAAAERR